jgi:hypothetical protein
MWNPTTILSSNQEPNGCRTSGAEMETNLKWLPIANGSWSSDRVMCMAMYGCLTTRPVSVLPIGKCKVKGSVMEYIFLPCTSHVNFETVGNLSLVHELKVISRCMYQYWHHRIEHLFLSPVEVADRHVLCADCPIKKFWKMGWRVQWSFLMAILPISGLWKSLNQPQNDSLGYGHLYLSNESVSKWLCIWDISDEGIDMTTTLLRDFGSFCSVRWGRASWPYD